LITGKLALGINLTINNYATLASFRQAIVNNQDNINALFSPNQDNQNGSYVITSPIVVNNNNHEILVSSSQDRVTISGGNSSQIFSISSSEGVTIQTMRIKNGFNSGFGGAVYLQNAKCSFFDVEFENNQSQITAQGYSHGGAIYCTNTTLSIMNCRFDENKCGLGGIIPTETCLAFGGAICANRSDVQINSSADSHFSENSAEYGCGGAIYLHECTFEISGLTLNDNTSFFDGGAIKIDAGAYNWIQANDKFRISECIFHNNSAVHDNQQYEFSAYGGGIACGDWDPDLIPIPRILIENCDFLGNYAERGGAVSCKNTIIAQSNENTFSNNTSVKGGAVFSDGGVTVVGATFESNSADLYGGAVFCNNSGCYTSFEKSRFVGSRALEGGAIYCVDNVLTVDSCNFDNNAAYCQGGAIAFPYTKSSVIQTYIYDSKFENCFVTDDQNLWLEYVGNGGAIMSSGQLTVKNTIFDNCYIINHNTAIGGAVRLGASDGMDNHYYFEHCLFIDCYTDPLSAAYDETCNDVISNNIGYLLQLETDIQFTLNNVTMSNCGLEGSYCTSSIFIDEQTDELTLNNNIFNFVEKPLIDMTGSCLAETSVWFPESIVNQCFFTSYDPQILNNGQLKNGSPCLDTGTNYIDENDNTVNSDQDLTPVDIGYMPQYEATTISGVQYNLPVGLYKVANSANAEIHFSDVLPSGTIFVMEAGSNLSIVGSSNTGSFLFGEPNDVRTTISTTSNAPAQSLIISGAANEVMDFEGVYCYQVPDNLIFKNSNIILDQNYSNTKLKIEGAESNTDFNISFEDCVGELREYNFDQTNGNLQVDYVSMLRSSVDVYNCHFGEPGTAGYALMVNGHFPLYDMKISECNFQGGSTSAPSIKLQDTDPRLEYNTFLNCLYYPIWSYLGVFGMDHGARNSLISTEQTNNLNYMMYLFNSPVYLECGENNFVYDNWSRPNFKFIYYRGSEPAITQGSEFKNYNRNYWGSTCATPVTSLVGKIPAWVNPGMTLPECTDPGDEYLGCPQIIEIEELFSTGLQNELQGDALSAISVYHDLIQTYPGSRASYAAALRVKGLGFLDDSGETVSEMQSLAEAAKNVDSHLGTYLFCSAECVRAWQGDTELARENLERMRDDAMTEDEAILAQKDLLEIDTYPVSNGIATLHSGMVSRMLQARQCLQSFDPEDPFRLQPLGNSARRPRSIRMESTRPNPFNPITTIHFNLWDEQEIAVRVYNL